MFIYPTASRGGASPGDGERGLLLDVVGVAGQPDAAIGSILVPFDPSFERKVQPVVIKKDFLFPENLLALLYLDTNEVDLLVKRIDKAIREFLPTRDERYAAEALTALDELANVHMYFELVRLEWRWRFAELKASGSENRSEWLPRKRITRIPAYVSEIQRQVIDLFDRALNMDGEKKPVSERVVEYYRQYKKNAPL